MQLSKARPLSVKITFNLNARAGQGAEIRRGGSSVRPKNKKAALKAAFLFRGNPGDFGEPTGVR
ncbi:hypothetical protein, partial [Roseibium hamelinense]|uniref:hypothetical protein n=1 Tax=Roseibium hamelinense TaxID=150831 RepID=UPI001AD91F10